MAGAPGEREKICASLARYFERRLLDPHNGEHQRTLPRGYRQDMHKESALLVIKHEASGVVANANAADFVERVDRSKRLEPAIIVFVYFKNLRAFQNASMQAHREPRLMFRTLVESNVLRPVEEAADGAWYRGAVRSSEPAAASAGDTRRGLAEVMPGTVEPEWSGAPYCIGVHLPAHQVRSSSESDAGYDSVELWFPGGPAKEVSPGFWIWPPALERPPQVDHGLRLVEAAAQRDEQTVRKLLQAKANPDFQDRRGWTALHAACATRPKWEVLDVLLGVCDICVRTHEGLLACDLADKAAHEEVSVRLKELMQKHRKAKHFPQATSALTAAAKAALGLTSVDWEAAAQVGMRRGEDEGKNMLHEFAVQLMSRYRSTDEAFKDFDINANGTLRRSEFALSCSRLKFNGDPTSIFKAIDVDRQGDVSKMEFRIIAHIYAEHLARLKALEEN